MNRIFLSTTLTLVAAAPFSLQAADNFQPENPNRFSIGPRIGFNFKANFRTRGTVPGIPGANTGPAVGGVNHSYDDGYVDVDSSANAGGLTWNWGYDNSSQVVGDTMQFHSLQSSGSSANKNVTGDPQYGFEVIYQRVLGPDTGESTFQWGLEAAFGFTDIDLGGNRRGSTSVTTTTDTFQLNGVTPPSAGYHGTFAGPGPLLGDTPTRTTASDTASIASRDRLSGQSFGVRLGPFAEWKITSELSLAASVGLALAPTSLDYDFSAIVTSGSGTTVTRGHASKTELLYGAYVSGMIRYDFNERWGVYLGAQFQTLSDMQVSSGNRTARLDPGAVIFATLGASWRF